MNCKSGDLAIVISAIGMPSHVGKIVKVTTIVNIAPWGAHWNTEICQYDEGVLVVYCDDDLRPVSGLPMEEDVRDEIKEKA